MYQKVMYKYRKGVVSNATPCATVTLLAGSAPDMFRDEELFDQVSVIDTPQEITVGDGYSVQATGKGNVILEMNLPNGKVWQCRLTDVLFVPDLSHNILSVSNAASNGKTFIL